jgi:hypothetical protein
MRSVTFALEAISLHNLVLRVDREGSGPGRCLAVAIITYRRGPRVASSKPVGTVRRRISERGGTRHDLG